MDNNSNGIIEWLYKQGSLGAILGIGLFVGYSGINAKIDSLSTRIDSVDTRIDSMNARIDNIDTRIDSVNARIDSVHADLKADIQEIKDREKWFMEHVIKNGDRISRIEGKLEKEQQQPPT